MDIHGYKRYPPDKPQNFFECVLCIGGVLPTTVGRLVPGGYEPNLMQKQVLKNPKRVILGFFFSLPAEIHTRFFSLKTKYPPNCAPNPWLLFE